MQLEAAREELEEATSSFNSASQEAAGLKQQLQKSQQELQGVQQSLKSSEAKGSNLQVLTFPSKYGLKLQEVQRNAHQRHIMAKRILYAWRVPSCFPGMNLGRGSRKRLPGVPACSHRYSLLALDTVVQCTFT